MTERARRIQRLRRRVAVGAVCTFAAAFGTVAASPAPQPAATTTSTVTEAPSADSTTTQTALAPAPVTTQQS